MLLKFLALPKMLNFLESLRYSEPALLTKKPHLREYLGFLRSNLTELPRVLDSIKVKKIFSINVNLIMDYFPSHEQINSQEI